jgi:hypothetical protein
MVVQVPIEDCINRSPPVYTGERVALAEPKLALPMVIGAPLLLWYNVRSRYDIVFVLLHATYTEVVIS